MLTMLDKAPEELLSEERTNSNHLDRVTRDGGDLRTYAGTSGQRYLRVWNAGAPIWFKLDPTELNPTGRKL